MRTGFKTVGIVSLALLISVLIGQWIWFNKVREIKLEEFRYTVTFILRENLNDFLDQETLSKDYKFSCGLARDGRTFSWTGGKSVQITCDKVFYEISRNVFYDYLFQHKYLNLTKIDSMYRAELNAKGIGSRPVLMIWDRNSGENLLYTDSLATYKGYIFAQPVDVGYECKHQVTAAFRKPWIFQCLGWHLFWEAVFLGGFIVCLLWQWCSVRMTWQNARVQTLGMAHLEHELKKPLAAMISAIDGMVNSPERELDRLKLKKLEMLKARLLKMSDVTDTMLTMMKTDRLEIEREPVNIRNEMEQIVEMFEVLRPYAKVNVRIDEKLKFPLLDKVYFNYLVMNLVDNAIKYAGTMPVVAVEIREEKTEYVLSVKDNGIGMPKKVLKRIFRQYYRVKDQRVAKQTGFGLGLAFVRKVVMAYGGKIKVESEVGTGSCFTICIPSHQKNEIES